MYRGLRRGLHVEDCHRYVGGIRKEGAVPKIRRYKQIIEVYIRLRVTP